MESRDKREEIWLGHMKKAPSQKKNPKSNVTTQKLHQNFDYTTAVDRLRTVSCSNNSHQNGVVKPVNGYPTFPLFATAV